MTFHLNSCYLCHICNNYGTNSNFPRLGLNNYFRYKSISASWPELGYEKNTDCNQFSKHWNLNFRFLFFSFHNIYNALVENKTKEPNKYNPNCQWYVKKLHSKSVLWWSTVLYTSVFTWTVICSLTHLNFTFFQNQKLFELWAHL